jgi:ribosomal protein S21
LRKGETIDKALRRLKKKIERESILRDVREKRYFEKPCAKRRNGCSGRYSSHWQFAPRHHT